MTYLPDWLEHNCIRADRKVDSIYKDLLVKIVPNATIKQAKPSYYAIKKTVDSHLTDKSQANDSIGKDRLDKDRLDKDSIEVCVQQEVDTQPQPPKKKQTTRFVPPTAEEVKQYCIENNYSLDAQRFVDFYECKGWMVGKNKMKNWKAAVRTWVRKDQEGVKKDEPREKSHSVQLWD